MAIVDFQDAVRQGGHALVALYGESGSGKTYSALLLARGLVGPKGRVALIDTETGRGRMYANVAPVWQHGELTPPFTPARYIEAIEHAERLKFDALIVDSASHEWDGIGGVIDMADAGRNSGLKKWQEPKKQHKRFVHKLLNARLHLILCLRAKEKLVQRDVSDGQGGTKKEIVSAGFVSIQEKGLIFETTVQLFMHNGRGERGKYTIEKCPEDLLGAFPEGERISIATGERLRVWVDGGEPVDREMADLKLRAEAAAEGGIEALRAFWTGLGKPPRQRLQPFMDNLKSIAEEADREAEAERAAEAEKKPDADLDDPFGRGVRPGPAAAKRAASPFEREPPTIVDDREVPRIAVTQGAAGPDWTAWVKALAATIDEAAKAGCSAAFIQALHGEHIADLHRLRALGATGEKHAAALVGKFEAAGKKAE